MEQVLQNLIVALRSSGVRISISETLDAMASATLMGYEDKQSLKDALSATLAKSPLEKEIFSDCFERFFSLDSFSEEKEAVQTIAPEPDREDAALTQMLLAGDNAGLSMAMREAAEEANITGIWFFTQKSLYVQRILMGMGAEALERDLRRAAGGTDPASQGRARALREAKGLLYEAVKNYVEQQYTLFSGSATEELIERYLRNMRLSNLEEQDYRRMYAIIQRMVKRLNDRHSRRKKSLKRGFLDLKKTLRENLGYQGFIFSPQWKGKKIDRPDIMALCDVSRSVEQVARFMLLFLYGVNKAVARIRSFIFCSNLVEVTHIFEEYAVDEALVRLKNGIDLGILLGRTDYGQAFHDFKQKSLERITNKTTVLILGDARNNYGDPQTETLRLIRDRSRRIIWLNPEPPSFWGIGDSEMKRYRPYCSLARECSTVMHLERVVDFLLSTGDK